MRKFAKFVTLTAVLALAAGLFTGCAKAPTEELAGAKAAIEAAAAEGATKYAAAELQGINDTLASAEAEIKVQEDKFFKNYDKAKEILAKAKADAEALKAQVPALKEAAKNAALAAQNEAVTAVANAEKLLAKAPVGKGTRADIEMYKNDLAGIKLALDGVQAKMVAEDFLEATAAAKDVTAKAGSISSAIEAAIAKVKR